MGNTLPNININTLEQKTIAGVSKLKVLIIGPTAGSAINGELISNVSLDSATKSKLGEKSLAYFAIDRFKKYNPLTDVDVLSLKPSGGSKAAGAFNVIGTATGSKTITVRIADDAFSVNINVVVGDNPAAIVAKFKTAVNAGVFPFTVVDSGSPGIAKIEFGVAGEVGNKLSVVVDGEVPGCSFLGNPFSGGTYAYSADDMLDSLTERYQTVVFDSCISYGAIEKWLVERDATPNEIMSGHGYTMIDNSIAEFRSMNENLPSEFRGHVISVFANPTEAKFNAIPLLMATEWASKEALRLTEDADITSIVVDRERSPGGMQTASLPAFNTPMSYRGSKGRLKQLDASNLYEWGFSLLVNTNENSVVTGQIKTMSQGKTGIFKNLENVRSVMFIKEFFFNNLKQDLSQSRLTLGPIPANGGVQNKKSISSLLQVYYSFLVEKQLIDPEPSARADFVNNLLINIKLAKGTVLASSTIALVSQLRSITLSLYYGHKEASATTTEG